MIIERIAPSAWSDIRRRCNIAVSGRVRRYLQRALHRAADMVPSSQVLVSAFEEYRDLWEPSFWFVRPEKRFVGVSPQASQLSVAAAILSVAECSTSDVITILPARCYVAHESILRRAIIHALAELPAIPEGVVTLGMLDLEEGIDEDYLVVGRARGGRSLRIDGFARQPVRWVARHLRQRVPWSPRGSWSDTRACSPPIFPSTGRACRKGSRS